MHQDLLWLLPRGVLVGYASHEDVQRKGSTIDYEFAEVVKVELSKKIGNDPTWVRYFLLNDPMKDAAPSSERWEARTGQFRKNDGLLFLLFFDRIFVELVRIPIRPMHDINMGHNSNKCTSVCMTDYRAN